jgi:hypothetical protein
MPLLFQSDLGARRILTNEQPSANTASEHSCADEQSQSVKGLRTAYLQKARSGGILSPITMLHTIRQLNGNGDAII